MTSIPPHTVHNAESPERAQAAAKQILDLLDSAERLQDRREQLHDASAIPSSQMAADDLATSPMQLSHLVGSYLTAAVDQIRTFRKIIRDEDGLELPIIAMYPQLRAVLENSALVVWLLVPDDSTERRIRLLRARNEELSYDKRLTATIAADHMHSTRELRSVRQAAIRGFQKTHGERTLERNRVIRRLKADQAIAKQALPRWPEILLDIEQNHPWDGRHLPTTIWMLASGLSHPSASRAMLVTSLEEVRVNADSSIKVNTRAILGPLASSLAVTLTIFETALDLTSRRMITPAS